MEFDPAPFDSLSTCKIVMLTTGTSATVKIVHKEILKPLISIVNISLLKCSFPDRMNIAQVHKKNSTLDKGNYRPVSVLSKIIERASLYVVS